MNWTQWFLEQAAALAADLPPWADRAISGFVAGVAGAVLAVYAKRGACRLWDWCKSPSRAECAILDRLTKLEGHARYREATGQKG